jgi:hypothetical protein
MAGAVPLDPAEIALLLHFPCKQELARIHGSFHHHIVFSRGLLGREDGMDILFGTGHRDRAGTVFPGVQHPDGLGDVVGNPGDQVDGINVTGLEDFIQRGIWRWILKRSAVL